MDLLINQPDLADDEDEEPLVANSNAQVRLFDRHGPFVSVRKFREANFQLNSNVNQRFRFLRRENLFFGLGGENVEGNVFHRRANRQGVASFQQQYADGGTSSNERTKKNPRRSFGFFSVNFCSATKISRRESKRIEANNRSILTRRCFNRSFGIPSCNER